MGVFYETDAYRSNWKPGMTSPCTIGMRYSISSYIKISPVVIHNIEFSFDGSESQKYHPGLSNYPIFIKD